MASAVPLPPLRARERRWLAQVMDTCPVRLPDTVWAAIAAAYTTPDRHYHTLQHLAELARAWRAVAAGPGWVDPEGVYLALLFHDAVQARFGLPGSDEDASARLLAEHLPGHPDAERLIRLTAGHGGPAEPLDPDAAHFLDADMAILGAPPGRYDRYEARVEAEYVPPLPPELFRAGRGAFVARLVAAPRLFRTEWFHRRLEVRARANLARVWPEAGGRAG